MRYWMFLLGLLMYANVAEAIDCQTPPDCESLGYSTENDPNCTDDGYMFCPFNHDYKKCVNYDCAALGFTTSDKTSWCKEIIKCQGNEDYTLCAKIPSCEIGDVYYANGSCGKASEYVKDSSPKPVGVVYWVTEDGQHGKVINLKDFAKNSNNQFDPLHPYGTSGSYFEWGSYGTDIKDLKNWNCNNGGYASTAKTGDHSDAFWSAGMKNTETISNALSNNLKYAAPAAIAFYPPEVSANDSKVGAGHWYVPTLGELMDLYGYDYSKVTNCDNAKEGVNAQTKNKVNATLATLKSKGVTAEKLTDGYYWSSSEHTSGTPWTLDITDGNRLWNYWSKIKYVRVSLQF